MRFLENGFSSIPPTKISNPPWQPWPSASQAMTRASASRPRVRRLGFRERGLHFLAVGLGEIPRADGSVDGLIHFTGAVLRRRVEMGNASGFQRDGVPQLAASSWSGTGSHDSF